MSMAYDELLVLLNEKKQLFLQYEVETDNIILNCNEDNIDIISLAMENRTRIAEKIDAITEKINSISIKNNIDLKLFADTLDCSSLETDSERSVHSIVEGTFDIIRRIQQKNTDIMNYFKNTMDNSKIQIEKNQYAPKISRYFENIKIDTNYNSTFGKG